MLQNFENPSFGNLSAARLEKLRAVMHKKGVTSLIVFHGDEQQNEYLPDCAERLAWISGFTGSAGLAIIGIETAALFVDGRYTQQAAEQVDVTHWSIKDYTLVSIETFLNEALSVTDTLAFHSWTTTVNWHENLKRVSDKAACALLALEEHPIDEIWTEQPSLPVTQVQIHPVERSGELARDKIKKVQEKLIEADAFIFTDPTSICWLLNIRGHDIPKTPLTLCWAIMHQDGVSLFIDPNKLNIEVKAYLNQLCDVKPIKDFVASLKELASTDQIVATDKSKTSIAIANHFASQKKDIADPVVALRAIKNETEIKGAKAAHKRDGAAMCVFLAWLDKQNPGTVDEITCAKKLEDIRHSTAKGLGSELLDLSFDTISATGKNAALPHYRVNENSNLTLQNGDLYLVDSGAQYADGTTDITRTVAVGEVNTEQKDRFTRVLKGHIAVQSTRFPKGTKGNALDPFARRALWEAGLDFAHGTGHGVGSYLSVHEGPQSISHRGNVAIQAGMITSNEPGYYKAEEFGIRIENLELACPAKAVQGGDIDMLYFQTLTLCPIDQSLILPELLTKAEVDWIDTYHERVREELTQLVDDETRKWLTQATTPLPRKQA